MKFYVLLLGLFCIQCLAADNKSPELRIKVEPDWSTLTSGYLIDVAEVQLIVLPTGQPFAIDSFVSLPGPVVQALSQWLFSEYRSNGPFVPFTITVNFPIRRPDDDDYASLQRPVFKVSNDDALAVRAGLELSPQKAAHLLDKLPNKEGGNHPRTSLLAYYSGKGALADPAAARQIRRDLIGWLVANDPAASVLASSYSIINPSKEPLADADAIPALTQHWLDVVKQYPSDRAITNPAINFLRVANPPAAFQVINALPSSARKGNWLGHVRAMAGIGVTAISPEKSTFLAVASSKLPDTDVALSSRQALLNSSDAHEVITAMLTTGEIAQDLVNNQAAIPDGYDQFCQALLTHTREFYPQTHADCKRPEPVVGGDKIPEIKLVRKMAPTYPPEARQRRIQGKVKFNVIIGKDGAPRKIEFLQGPFAFYQESYNTVSQWRWTPALRAGVAVEVQTEVKINYTF